MGWFDRFRKEVIGNPECPIMHRWTLIGEGNAESKARLKVIVHHFLPNGDDPDPHDHPRGFVTLILRGGYVDWVPCPSPHEPYPQGGCALCLWGDHPGMVVGDRMRPGMIRRRKAEHVHITSVGPEGCWSLVIMGPLRRPWGFLWNGDWWPWRRYLAERGEIAIRCPE